MNSPSTLAFFQRIDPAQEAERFYLELCRKLVLLNPADRLEVLSISEKAKHVSDLNYAGHYFGQAMTLLYAANFKQAILDLDIASEVFEKIDHKGGLMACATITATSYRSMGQLDKAQIYLKQALEYLPEVPLSDIYGYFKVVTHYQAAEISLELKNYEKAYEHYHAGLEFSHENAELKGRILSGLGVLSTMEEKWDEAITYLENALHVISGSGNKVLESKVLADIGNYYFRQNDLKRSKEYQEHSLKMRVDNGMLNPAITNYIRLAETCLALGEVEAALRFGNLAADNAEKLKVNIKLYEAHQVLSAIYEKMGDIPNAYLHFKKYNQHREEVHNQEVIRRIEQLQTQYKIESAQQEKEIFRLRNVELKVALDEIRESFRYAQRIQTAILPPQKLVEDTFKDSFVLFRPKDIVSGDFYWMEKIKSGEQGAGSESVLFAAVDCTGHGVPGAMVSMVGNNCLNRTVHEFGLTKPAEILDKLTGLVEGTFMHKELQYAEEEIKDGMDISLCSIDLKNKRLYWSGANNPLWIMKGGTIQEITADKQPIGKFEMRQPFTLHEMQLEQGDCIYLFTDGFADQFGGPAGKKFKYKQLKELLESMNNEKMSVQKERLIKAFEDWKGELEQIDDVCIIGVRL